MSTGSSTDCIEKQTVLRAPLDRVWRALTDAREFGSWFGMKLDGPFESGKPVHGTISPTTVDAAVAKAQKAFEGKPVQLWIEQLEPRRLFSFRWHPYAVQADLDDSKEPTTLVTFELREQDGGVLLKLTETGFDRLPPSRRAEAFMRNDGGWSKQMELIAGYLANGR